MFWTKVVSSGKALEEWNVKFNYWFRPQDWAYNKTLYYSNICVPVSSIDNIILEASIYLLPKWSLKNDTLCCRNRHRSDTREVDFLFGRPAYLPTYLVTKMFLSFSNLKIDAFSRPLVLPNIFWIYRGSIFNRTWLFMWRKFGCYSFLYSMDVIVGKICAPIQCILTVLTCIKHRFK